MPPRSVLLNLGLPNVFTAGKQRTDEAVTEARLQVQSEEEKGSANVGRGKTETRDRSHSKHDSMQSSPGDFSISALNHSGPTPSGPAIAVDAISPLTLSNSPVDFTAPAESTSSNRLTTSNVALHTEISRPARVCDNCGFAPTTSDVTLKQCSRCKIALYCSAKCQKGNWPAHKKSCKPPAVLTTVINQQRSAVNSPTRTEQEKETETFADFSGSSTPISPSEDGTSTAATSPGLYFDYKTELLNSPYSHASASASASASIPPA